MYLRALLSRVYEWLPSQAPVNRKVRKGAKGGASSDDAWVQVSSLAQGSLCDHICIRRSSNDYCINSPIPDPDTPHPAHSSVGAPETRAHP